MSEIDNQMKSVSFTRMADGTAEEYAFFYSLIRKMPRLRVGPTAGTSKSNEGGQTWLPG